MKAKICANHGKYTDRNGVEKVSWKEIGELYEGKNGKTYMTLNVHPGQFFNVFPKDDNYQQQSKQYEEQGLPLPTDPVVDEVPF